MRVHSTQRNRFNCTICKASFLDNCRQSFKRHNKLHEHGIECKECRKPFPDQKSLDLHVWSHSTERRRYKCDRCNQTFLHTQTLNRHTALHDLGIECNICKKPFRDKKYLEAHKWKHSNERRKYDCAICGASYLQGQGLKQHYKVHEHGFECSICKRPFSMERSLKFHVKTHSRKVNGNNGIDKSKVTRTAKSSSNILRMRGRKKKHTLTKENNETNNKEPVETKGKMPKGKSMKRIRHKKDGQIYQCPICSVSYKNTDCLNAHVRAAHTGENCHDCQICGKRYGRPSELKRHMITHYEGPSLQCTMCDKKLKHEYSLRKHMKLHTEIKKYECKICHRRFSRTAHLNIHMPTHTGKKNFKCSECGKAFAAERGLELHKMLHTGEKPHKCAVCNTYFRQLAHLKTHMRGVHRKERNFKCETCGKMNASNAALKVHQRIHTGEKPYTCSICNRAFAHKISLTRHKCQNAAGGKMAMQK